MFSPTLVKRSPEPRAWVMGDLSDRRVLSNLLLMCGLEPRKLKRWLALHAETPGR